MTLTVDASTVVAALVDSGPAGQWAIERLRKAGDLVAPTIMPVEAANVLRRLEASGKIDEVVADRAFSDLRRLPVTLVDFGALADRVWALRSNLTSYDASYVASAELTRSSLATLDERLANAPGPTCRMANPPAESTRT